MTAKETIISHNERLETLKSTVETLPDQVILPELTNPAAAAHILNGYEAIDGEGKPITGTAGSSITKPATAAKISAGYQAMLADGMVLTGTMVGYGLETGSVAVSAGKTSTITLSNTPAYVFIGASKGRQGVCDASDGSTKEGTLYSYSSSYNDVYFTVNPSAKTLKIDNSYDDENDDTFTYWSFYKL